MIHSTRAILLQIAVTTTVQHLANSQMIFK